MARQFNVLELEYCTVESDVKYAFFVLQQVLLLDKNIDVMISRARGTPSRPTSVVVRPLGMPIRRVVEIR